MSENEATYEIEEPESLIKDAGDLHKYRTEIPNMVDDSDLSVYAFRLYAHLKRVAGDAGMCWQSTQTLAESCRMAVGSVSDAKKELVEKSLIAIEKVNTPKGKCDQITIKNVWPQNFKLYTGRSPHERGRSHSEQVRSPHETKKNSIKKNPVKNSGRLAADPRTNLPEIQLYKQITGRNPNKQIYDDVIATLSGKTLEQVQPYFKQWVKRGYKETNTAWLFEWMTSGNSPEHYAFNGNGKHATEPRGMSGARAIMAMED